MLRFIKTLIVRTIRAAGYTLIRTDEFERKRDETVSWVALEERKIADRRSEVHQWAEVREREINAKADEVRHWAAATERRINLSREEMLSWLAVGESAPVVDAGGNAMQLVGAPFVVTDAEELETDQQPDRIAELDCLLDLVSPWSGDVPNGYLVDSFGILTDMKFRPDKTKPAGGEFVQTRRPSVSADDEGYFEAISWLASAKDARGEYVAVSFGASYGAQIVGPWKALQAINPMPARLIAVEAVPENCAWIAKHCADNGIRPEQYTIIQAAIGRTNDPVLFPVGAPGSGRTGCADTNMPSSRAAIADLIQHNSRADQVLRNLLVSNSTGMMRDLGDGFHGELKFVSTVTLPDIIGPLEKVDFLESDIQGSELDVLGPHIDLLTGKVRRVHIGTHGVKLHKVLRSLFIRAGWDVVFDFAGETEHETKLGSFYANDGILTARNPFMLPA